jgi:hypothetical protein
MTPLPIEDEKMKMKNKKKKVGSVTTVPCKKGIKGGQNIKENKVCLP